MATEKTPAKYGPITLGERTPTGQFALKAPANLGGPATFALVTYRPHATFIVRSVNCHTELLAALRIARDYVEVTAQDIRESQTALDAVVPPRSDRARAEDALTLAEVEAHLALIDAAIDKAEAHGS